MKISEFKNLNDFLCILFEFFEKNNIKSSLAPINDYDNIRKEIIDADFICYSCCPGIKQYGIDFRLSHRIDKAEIYMLIFGNSESNRDCDLLIDLGERELTSFFNFSWYEQKLPPFFKDFIDKGNKIIISNTNGTKENKSINDSELMTFEEFRSFLEENREHRSLKWIEVD